MSHLLEFEHVSYSYHSIGGETLALSDISFTMDAGEFTAIVGPSGCGKSTLLNLICHLALPEQGAIFYHGEPPDKQSVRSIGYMLQKDHLFDWRTIEKNICLGLEIQKNFPRRQRLTPHICCKNTGCMISGTKNLLNCPAACAREPPLYARLY